MAEANSEDVTVGKRSSGDDESSLSKKIWLSTDAKIEVLDSGAIKTLKRDNISNSGKLITGEVSSRSSDLAQEPQGLNEFANMTLPEAQKQSPVSCHEMSSAHTADPNTDLRMPHALIRFFISSTLSKWSSQSSRYRLNAWTNIEG